MFQEVFKIIFRLKKICVCILHTLFICFRHSRPTPRTWFLISDTPDRFALIVDIRYNGWEEVRKKVIEVARVAEEKEMNHWKDLTVWMRDTTRHQQLPQPTPLTSFSACRYF